MIAVAAMSACSGDLAPTSDSAAEPVAEAESAVSLAQPVGLALEIDNGVGVAVQLRAGQKFYLNQIDIRASLLTSVDEGVDGLSHQGDFAALPWSGLTLRDHDFSVMPNAGGKFDRRRFYVDASWMKEKSSFTLQQLDASGAVLGSSVVLDLGKDEKQKSKDDFFVRRLRAMQWTHDCTSPTDCSGAAAFEEEALVEVRSALDTPTPFTLAVGTTALRLRWSLQPGAGYVIPVTQIAAPQYDHGFSIDLDVLTPPGANGSYAPGSDLTVQATLRDGSGNRLHPVGSLPSYLEVEFGPNPAGLQYYRAFFDPTITYYRRKHREGMMVAQLVGPVEDVQADRNIVGLEAIFSPDPVVHAAIPERDGYFGDVVTFPRTNSLFGGAFDPAHAAWADPVSDTWTHHLPANAKPGTYLLTMKARRLYLGEDSRVSRTIKLQVGSPTPTAPNPSVGNCGSCHSGGGALSNVLHGNDNLATCNACHTPLANEHDSPVYVRTHFIHSRSNRYDAPLANCSECHTTAAGIQRTSKSACMSCHTSYPASHVSAFGPITSPFVGGGAESFNQCSTTCHVTHPKGRLDN